jgi:tRNA U34 5-methylaminomethyl-2-thiouridine-forming methyltransferase MnmC
MEAPQKNAVNQALEWRDGQPYSTQFQDIYFSSDDGLAETDYVFLQGNNLPKRFQQLDLNSSEFIIIETGFGTGLNFLCAAKLWLELTPVNARLHFISTEKYPLSLPDIAAAHSLWPCLKVLSQEFLLSYPTLLDAKLTANLLDGRVQITLLIGDANTTLKDLTIKADAWFLDGFAPAKNPDMWQVELFSQMTRLSNPGTTFATFTSAGTVRRSLQTAGFSVTKQPGFGKKREMLIGQYIGPDTR